MNATINGLDVTSLRLTRPAQGIWVLSAEVASEDEVTGALTLEQDSVTMSGTIVRSGVVAGTCRIEAVGGKGGLRSEVPARSYQGVTSKAVLSDLIAAVGEQLDASSSRAALSVTLPYWTRAMGTASSALATLVDALGARWRVLPSGLVWVGSESWPKVADSFDFIEVDRDPGAGNVLIAPESIALGPGVTLGSDRVGRVEHVLSLEAPLRTTYWISEDA